MNSSHSTQHILKYWNPIKSHNCYYNQQIMWKLKQNTISTTTWVMARKEHNFTQFYMELVEKVFRRGDKTKVDEEENSIQL